MQEKAVNFLRNVVGDSDKADEFEAMSPEEYAERKRVEIRNPSPSFRGQKTRTQAMPAKRRLSREELEDRVSELESENEALNEKLDAIQDIATAEDDEEEEELDDSEDDDDED
jgi:hypothetical protein